MSSSMGLRGLHALLAERLYEAEGCGICENPGAEVFLV